jgi:hypothetical protein
VLKEVMGGSASAGKELDSLLTNLFSQKVATEKVTSGSEEEKEVLIRDDSDSGPEEGEILD